MNSENSENETVFDVFGKSVAMQLKNLSLDEALTAQQKIQCILTEIGIQDYREKNGCTTSMSNYSYQSVSVASPPLSAQSNYGDIDGFQFSDENVSDAENYPFLSEQNPPISIEVINQSDCDILKSAMDAVLADIGKE